MTLPDWDVDRWIEDRDDYQQFEMMAWQEYALDFAMDASGELREEIGPQMGKRKQYDSSVCCTGFLESV